MIDLKNFVSELTEYLQVQAHNQLLYMAQGLPSDAYMRAVGSYQAYEDVMRELHDQFDTLSRQSK